MKKFQFPLTLATLALALIFVSCKENVDATGVKLNKTTAELRVGETSLLTATVEPDKVEDKSVKWESSNPYIVSVDQNGSITAHTGGSAIIKATSNNGAKTASCEVNVDLIVESKFRTNREWSINSGDSIQQIWSDVVIAEGCQKDTFLGFVHTDDVTGYIADCRRAPIEGYGDMFSFEAVELYKDKICPEGWRVPTRADFQNLDKALGGTGKKSEDSVLMRKYLDEWGAEDQWYCYHAYYNTSTGKYSSNTILISATFDEPDGQMFSAIPLGYWSQTKFGTSSGYSLVICRTRLTRLNENGIPTVIKISVDMDSPETRFYGYPIRCIKN